MGVLPLFTIFAQHCEYILRVDGVYLLRSSVCAVFRGVNNVIL